MNAKEKIEKIITDTEKMARDNFGKADEISIKIATTMFMGCRELKDVFKFFTGRSLNEYVKERKMMAAYDYMLRQEKLNIDKAIEISGLDNQSSFGKKFKEVFDMTPQEAFSQKDKSKYRSPLSWDLILSTSNQQDKTVTDESKDEVFFGISIEQYRKILQAQEYQALYDLNDKQSSIAFKISEEDQIPLRDAYAFVEDYSNYCECISGKCVTDDELEFLMSYDAKKLKEIYFNMTKSVTTTMDIIDTATENKFSLTKKNTYYLWVYCDDPYCDFEEFLKQVKKFEELQGEDFEEYWELIYVWGFSPEDAVKGYNDSSNEYTDIEELDMIFERWATEQTDYVNQEKIDVEYDEDNPYYSNDYKDEDGISYTET